MLLGRATARQVALRQIFKLISIIQRWSNRCDPQLYWCHLLTTGATTGPQTVTGCQAGNIRTWTDVLASRSAGSSYVNNTGHDIEVSASTYSGAAFKRCSIYISVNGVITGQNWLNSSIGDATCNATVTVPFGSSYVVNNAGCPRRHLLAKTISPNGRNFSIADLLMEVCRYL